MRSRPVPWAYRVLYRHLGIDPDVTRTPVEELVARAAPARAASRPAGCRRTRSRSRRSRPACPSRRSTPTGSPARSLLAPDEGGRLVLADDGGPVAVLFEPPEPDRAPGRRTRALALLAVQAPGVDDLFVEEAVWTAAAAMPTIDAPS